MNLIRLAETPLRFKLVVTLLGTAVLLITATTIISHRYWRDQSRVAAEQQVLLASQTLHTTLGPSLRYGRWEEASRQFETIARRLRLSSAQVIDGSGQVVLTLDPSNAPSPTRWLPAWEDIPDEGLVHSRPDTPTVVGYQRLHTPGRHILEAEFPVALMETSMRNASRLGMALLLASILTLGIILLIMAQREIFNPVQRLEQLLAAGSARTAGSPDEFHRIEARVSRLLEEERELESKEGLAEVGQLAAEMAHEFKRPLASIYMALELFRQEFEMGDQEKGLLHNIEGQLGRINETMRDLLALARPVEAATDPVDLAKVLDSALIQLSTLASAQGVRIQPDYEHGGVLVHGDSHRLELAFANILLNAIQAMPQGGDLEVGIRRNGDQLEVVTRDHGVGMSEADCQRALRPFYSTKAQGTGLGLSLVARVVEAHSGKLLISSQVGQGTTVTIRLPIATLSSSIPEQVS